MKAIRTRASSIAAFLITLAAMPASAQTQPDGVVWNQYQDGDVVYTVQQGSSAQANPEKVGPQWLRLYGYPASWPNGVYKWYLNPNNLPAGVTAEQLRATTEGAMGRWAQMCNVSFQYQGTTNALPNTKNAGWPDYINVVGFIDFKLLGQNTNYAGLTYPTHAPTGSSSVLPSVIIDADIALNNAAPITWTQDNLDGSITHEIGHLLGLDHSDKAASIMFANPYHVPTYNETLRGDDVAGCTAIYGASGLQQINRTINWAESIYPNLLNNGTSASPPTLGWNGYIYRYYSKTNAYVGSKDGRAYYLGPDGNLQDVGALNDFNGLVSAAGY